MKFFIFANEFSARKSVKPVEPVLDVFPFYGRINDRIYRLRINFQSSIEQRFTAVSGLQFLIVCLTKPVNQVASPLLLPDSNPSQFEFGSQPDFLLKPDLERRLAWHLNSELALERHNVSALLAAVAVENLVTDAHCRKLPSWTVGANPRLAAL